MLQDKHNNKSNLKKRSQNLIFFYGETGIILYFMLLDCALVTKEGPVGARNVAGIPFPQKNANMKTAVVL